jgi:arginine/ornithine transport system substrate-binding protein
MNAIKNRGLPAVGPDMPGVPRGAVRRADFIRVVRGLIGEFRGRSVLTLLLLALIGGAVPAAPATLRIGIFGQEPPLSFIDAGGVPRGFDVELARALCAQLRAHCDLVPTDWDDLIPRVQAGTLDAAVASLSITAARRDRVAFTRPYYQGPARYVARAGGLTRIDADTLAGKRIGVRRGTTFEDYLTATRPGEARIVRYSTTDDALVDLLLGRLDLVLGDQLLLDQGFLRKDQGRGFAFVGKSPSDPRLLGDGLGVAVRPDDPDLAAALDTAVASLTDSGVLATLARRWLGDQPPDPNPVGAPQPRPSAAPRPKAPTDPRR